MNNGNGRRASIMSRSSSMENVKMPVPVDNVHRNSNQPCLWNLDFTPYSSPLIRMKYVSLVGNQSIFPVDCFRCLYRFLSVFGLGLHPSTVLKEVNYSCF